MYVEIIHVMHVYAAFSKNSSSTCSCTNSYSRFLHCVFGIHVVRDSKSVITVLEQQGLQWMFLLPQMRSPAAPHRPVTPMSQVTAMDTRSGEEGWRREGQWRGGRGDKGGERTSTESSRTSYFAFTIVPSFSDTSFAEDIPSVPQSRYV